MKVYLSADIEGVTGTLHWDETMKSKPDHKEFAKQMTAEVAAACEGFLEAGAEEIWVQDAHDSGRNIDASELPREAKLVRGWSGHPMSMAQMLDESFDAVAMLGYHSSSGSAGSPLAHTMSTRAALVTINGVPASEFMIHSYAASSVGVPVVLVTGDEALCAEVASVNPGARTVAVKSGVGGAVVSIHPKLATERIRRAAAESLDGDLASRVLKLPERFRLEVRYREHSLAYKFGFYPGARAVDDFTVALDVDDYQEVMRYFLFAV